MYATIKSPLLGILVKRGVSTFSPNGIVKAAVEKARKRSKRNADQGKRIPGGGLVVEAI